MTRGQRHLHNGRSAMCAHEWKLTLEECLSYFHRILLRKGCVEFHRVFACLRITMPLLLYALCKESANSRRTRQGTITGVCLNGIQVLSEIAFCGCKSVDRRNGLQSIPTPVLYLQSNTRRVSGNCVSPILQRCSLSPGGLHLSLCEMPFALHGNGLNDTFWILSKHLQVGVKVYSFMGGVLVD